MKKYVIGLCLLVIIIFALGFSVFNNNTNIGTDSKSSIIVPKGFQITNTTKYSITLYNDNSNYLVVEHHNKTIDKIVDQYVYLHRNHSVSVTSKDLNGVNLTGLELYINDTYVHTNYYYEKNGMIYQIYPSSNYDLNIIKQIVDSTNKKMF